VVTLAAWGAGLGVLAQRQLNRTASDRLAEAAVRLGPGAVYFSEEEAGRHVGFASVTIDTVPGGLLVTNYAVRDRRDGLAVVREVDQTEARFSRGLKLQQINVSRGARAYRTTASLEVQSDSQALIIRTRGGVVDSSIQVFRPPLLLPTLVPTAIALGDRPSVGSKHTYDVYDDDTFAIRRMQFTVAAESLFVVVDSASWDSSTRRWLGAHADTVRGWRVSAADGDLDIWIDPQGRQIQSRRSACRTLCTDTSSAVLRRTAYELAFENWRSGSPLSRATPDATDVPLDWPIDAAIEHSAITLGQLNLSQLNVAGPWQLLSNDTLRVVRATLPNATGYWLPPHRAFRTEHARDLRIEPLLEVEEPAVKALAMRIRASDPDPRRVAAALSRWISDSITLGAVDGRPSALEAIRSRAGDPRRHTNLFVALSRALGMPARRVSGVLVRGESLRPWQWAEVLLDNVWVPADPSIGSFPADAGHVRLFTAVTDCDAALERLIARHSVRVVHTPAAISTPHGTR